MILRPTRDTFGSLPDVTEDLATHAGLGGLTAGHDPARGGQDVDAEPAVDARDLALAAVDAAAGLAHALQVGDHALPAGAVAEEDAQSALPAVVDQPEVRDVALVLQDAGDLGLQLGRGDVDLDQPRPHPVPDAGDHVRDGIRHVHRTYLEVLPARLDHARNLARQGQLPEADPAHLELADVGAGPAAQAAPGVGAHRELRLALRLGDHRQLGHSPASYWFRNGIPRCARSAFDSSSLLAVVTNVTFMPRSFSTLA